MLQALLANTPQLRAQNLHRHQHTSSADVFTLCPLCNNAGQKQVVVIMLSWINDREGRTEKQQLQGGQEGLVLQQSLQLHVASVAPVVLAHCGVVYGFLRRWPRAVLGRQRQQVLHQDSSQSQLRKRYCIQEDPMLTS